ncbi:MAG: hypothetical protein BroJett014_18680 [Planctomycetota bacterium]|nr:hypothetical protein [Planctomycetota bacterium]GIK52895.1 MAG: hypothetical protein BroJett014_18680 [Planctomycetota bacterium]
MWDRSYRFLRLTRLAAGGLTLGAGVLALAGFARSEAAARSSTALAEIAREADASHEGRLVVRLPRSLGVKAGNLVHREREDGAAEIIGRVIAVREDGGACEATLMLTPRAASEMKQGATLKGAPATVSLESAVRLLLAPDIPRDEAARAKDALWPSLEKHVLPGITARMEKELVAAVEDLSPEDEQLLRDALDELHRDLAPLEEKLLNRMAERAWEVVGVGGVAEGIVRKAADGAGNTYKDVKDWVRGIFGSEEKSEKSNRDFLSEEKKIALRLALEEEATKFWDDNRKEIVEKLGKVLSARKQDFADAFNKRWAPRLYEKAVVPAWFEGERNVIEAAENYAVDFSNRRLLTSQGGPRLLLAHALRGALSISDAPLLVLARDSSPGVKFDYLIPALDGEGRRD